MIKDFNENHLQSSINNAFLTLKNTFENSGKLLICGNGGSASDADHIVGELVKGFEKKRNLNQSDKEKFTEIDKLYDTDLTNKIQNGMPAFSLSSHTALTTAIINDQGSDYIFAQQVWSLGKKQDTLLAISTSGNSKNVLLACIVAKKQGLKIIGLTGYNGGKLEEICDVCIKSNEDTVATIQESHIKIYHALCRKLENNFYN